MPVAQLAIIGCHGVFTIVSEMNPNESLQGVPCLQYTGVFLWQTVTGEWPGASLEGEGVKRMSNVRPTPGPEDIFIVEW